MLGTATELIDFPDFMKILADRENKEKSSIVAKKAVYAFFSIDLVNSTAYKNFDREWQRTFILFYKIAEDIVTKAINDTECFVWKYVGDEVLFYIEVPNIDVLCDLPAKLYNSMREIEKRLYNAYSRTKNFLYLKSALWIAPVEYSSSMEKLSERNVFVELPDNYDFIGVDMDEGFRMSKFTSVRKMVVDPKIAYLVYEKQKSEHSYKLKEYLRIVDLVQLKGSWERRFFPVVWYSEYWNEEKELFLYDEHLTNEVVNKIRSNDNKYKELSYIEKVFAEQGYLDTPIKNINEIFSMKDKLKIKAISNSGKTALHCSVICFKENGRAFIVKRDKLKEICPDCWEFGGFESTLDADIVNEIIHTYQNLYGLTIKLINDEASRPLPIAIYEFCKSRGVHKGILFVAHILDCCEVEDQTSKYIAPDDFDESEILPTVPNFWEDLRKAFELFCADSSKNSIES